MSLIKIIENREKVREELINYVKTEVKKGHYPSRRYLERKFKINVAPVLFNSIKDLYQKAGLKYKQENSQELKNKKAKILTDIAISILPKLNLELIESKQVHQHGIDILAKDKNGNIVGVEIKAHNKNEPIKQRNIQQLQRFLEKSNFNRIILITTTSKFENNLIDIKNLEIIDYNKLKELCDEEQLNKLDFVRNKSIHQETEEKEIKRQLIIDYAKKRVKQGTDISYKDILKDLHLHSYTYFNSLYDIYDQADILPPLRKIRGRRASNNDKYYEKIILKILGYMKEEITKGHYPSGVDIGNKFGVRHIWNFLTMTELYQRLGLPVYHKREIRGSRHLKKEH